MKTTPDIQLDEIPKAEDKTKVFVLPPLADGNENHLKILIQTDGNNRAKGLNEGYDDGGKNVVKIAEYLAGRGDVSTMLACIMSCDNADKRSENFFWNMYQAFVALGMRIQTDGILIKDKIKLNVKGQLEKLKAKGGNAQKLAEMIEQVCRLTDGIKEPRLTLSLGVNYDADIALDNEVDIIIRSGMEELDAVRLSGMRSNPRISNVGSTTLWPYMSTSEIDSIIGESKKKIRRGFKTGYLPENIVKIITATQQPVTPEPITVSIPFSGNEDELISTLDKNFLGTQNQDSFTVHVIGKNGEIIRTYGDELKNRTFHMVQGSNAYKFHPEDGYNMIIAPGQPGSEIVLPETPEADYATVMSCEKNPEAIAETIKKAIAFCMTHEKLKGAERKKTAGINKKASDLDEYKRYQQLQKHFQKNGSVEETAKKLYGENSQLNLFELKADLFVAKMLEWGEKIGAPLERDVEFLAFTNYALTSFFMVYFPEHPEWQKYSTEWEKRAEILAKYMELIYMSDEAIYDIEDENPETKMPRITRATKILTAAIYDKDTHRQDEEEVNSITKNIAHELRNLSRELGSQAQSEIYRRWQNALAHLFRSFTDEWNETIFKNPLVQNMFQQNTETVHAEFHKKYFEGKPAFVQKKLTAALDNKSPSKAYDIQLFTYLFDIENSIGAGLAYRTLATTIPHGAIDQEFITGFEEICTLSNLYFRLANDLSGFLSRNQGDIETKQDACSIMTAKHMALGKKEPEAILNAAAEIKTLIDELKVEILSKRTKFTQQWPQLGTSIIRADIAELIYKEGHYRTTTRDKMSSHFDKLKKSGIVEAINNYPGSAQSEAKP